MPQSIFKRLSTPRASLEVAEQPPGKGKMQFSPNHETYEKPLLLSTLDMPAEANASPLSESQSSNSSSAGTSTDASPEQMFFPRDKALPSLPVSSTMGEVKGQSGDSERTVHPHREPPAGAMYPTMNGTTQPAGADQRRGVSGGGGLVDSPFELASPPSSPPPSTPSAINHLHASHPRGAVHGSGRPHNHIHSPPLHGRRAGASLQRPVLGLPQFSALRLSPAVLLTPAPSRSLNLFALPTVPSPPPENSEVREEAARQARRVVPVLMSPGLHGGRDRDDPMDADVDMTSSPGTSDDEGDGDGDESDGTSEGTEGDGRSSSDGSSTFSAPLTDTPPSRARQDSGSNSSSSGTAVYASRTASPARQPRFGLGLPTIQPPLPPVPPVPPVPASRPAHTWSLPTPVPGAEWVQFGDGTPTPGPTSRAAKSRERERDYFSSKVVPPLPERSPAQTPRPQAQASQTESPRPGLYHQVSRSLIDLTAEARKKPVPEVVPVPKPILPPPVVAPAPAPAAPAAGPALVRRRSMPILNPPPYLPAQPAAPPYSPRIRHDDEGRERLPAYTCSVHIEGTLERKMEFSAPGVQARDRSWKKYWFELHGTALKVFRQDLRKVGVRGQKAWDGTGCFEGGKARHVHLAKKAPEPVAAGSGVAMSRVRTGSASQLREEARSQPRRTSIASSMASARRPSVSSSHTSSSNNTSSGSAPPSAFHFSSSGSALSSNTSLISNSNSHSNSTSSPSSSPSPSSVSPPASSSSTSPFEKSPLPTKPVVPALSSTGASTSTTTTGTNTSSSSIRHPHLPSFHHGNALLRHYTMQGAESGLGADYKKRKNVIRVRAEGEQFLLQAESLVDVVNWIEAFQAATNIALDLDDRPMPKIPTLPRRRRRRRPPTEGAPVAADANGAPPDAQNPAAAASATNNSAQNNSQRPIAAQNNNLRPVPSQPNSQRPIPSQTNNHRPSH